MLPEKEGVLKRLGLSLIFFAGFWGQQNVFAGAFFEADDHFIGGYDPVAYFTEKQALLGSDEFVHTYEDPAYGSTQIKFKSKANLNKFTQNPKKYLPQFNGWCAYAVLYGSKAEVDPKTFKLIEGKLYLFYNRKGLFSGGNTLKKWNKKAK